MRKATFDKLVSLYLDREITPRQMHRLRRATERNPVYMAKLRRAMQVHEAMLAAMLTDEREGTRRSNVTVIARPRRFAWILPAVTGALAASVAFLLLIDRSAPDEAEITLPEADTVRSTLLTSSELLRASFEADVVAVRSSFAAYAEQRPGLYWAHGGETQSAAASGLDAIDAQTVLVFTQHDKSALPQVESSGGALETPAWMYDGVDDSPFAQPLPVFYERDTGQLRPTFQPASFQP